MIFKNIKSEIKKGFKRRKIVRTAERESFMEERIKQARKYGKTKAYLERLSREKRLKARYNPPRRKPMNMDFGMGSDIFSITPTPPSKGKKKRGGGSIFDTAI